MKKIVLVLIGLILVVCLIITVLILNLDGIVRRTVESQTQKQLELPAQLADAETSIFGGTLKLRGYSIGSPQGYSAPAMFSVDGISVAVAYSQLRQDPVRIQEIKIDAPQLVIEYGEGKFNYQVLIDKASTPGAEEQADSEPLRLIIDHLIIDQATVVLRLAGLKEKPLVGAIDLSGLPIRDEYRLTIPRLDMRSIGAGEGAENGAAVREVVMQIVTALTAKAAESEELPKELRAVLSGNLQDVLRGVGEEARRQLGKALEDVGGEAGQILQGVLEGVGGEGDPRRAVEQGIQQGIERGIGSFLNGRKDEQQKEKDSENRSQQPQQQAPQGN